MSPVAIASQWSKQRTLRRKARNRSLRIETLEARQVLSTTYLVHDLVSDQQGVAPLTDTDLVNGWGISLNPTGGGFWISSNGKDLADIYTGDVSGSPIVKPASSEVTITGGAPTGSVFNTTTDFKIPMGAPTAAATYIFASESGAVTGWNPSVNANTAVLGFQASDSAIYKGIALANDSVAGQNYLYVADFHNNKIDVLDTNFHLVAPGTPALNGTFTDPNLPAGFAPFNVAEINGQLYVSYAKQDNPADAEDDVAGAGHGLVDIYTNDGVFVQRLISNGAGSKLNSPWAMVVAPASFGDFGGDLLVGNFGDGRINAYNPTSGAFLGTLRGFKNHPVVVDGLWGLAFGNGVTAGDTNTLYFAAGPDDEGHGLFGKITANPQGTSPVTAVLNGDVLNVTGGPDGDNILVRLKRPTHQIIVQNQGVVVGTFDASSVSTIEVQSLAGNDHVKIGPKIDATTILDGGAGNDKLFGSKNSSNILLGNIDNDMLFGGRDRDILIGGDGKDHMHGLRADDILIGGSTADDTNTVALLQILDEWTSTDSFNDRVTKLSSGAGGLPILDNTTVIDDGVVDHLVGGPGHNLFFAGTGDKHSKH